MKKSLLAVAIPSLLCATSASAVQVYDSEEGFADFYGHLRTEIKKEEDKDVTLNAGKSRAGVILNYNLTDTVDAVAKVEYGLNYIEGKDYTLKNRQHYTGLATDFGKLTFGRQWVVSDNVGTAEYSYFFGGLSKDYSYKLLGARHDSYIKYYYGGENFWAAAGYGLNEDDTNPERTELYAGTSYGGFNLHLGGGQNRDKNAKKNGGRDSENTYYEGTVEYVVGAAMIGFTYYNAEFQDKANGQEINNDTYSLAALYKWAGKSKVYAGIELADQEASDSSVKDGDLKTFHIGADYHFNKFSRIYAEYGYGDGTTVSFTEKGSTDNFSVKDTDAENSFAIGYRLYW